MKIKEVKRIIKDNKKEIFIFGGSATMLGLGVYCLTKSTVMDIEKAKGLLPKGECSFDILKDKDISRGFMTLEYVDGEIGIINVDSPGVLDDLFSKMFPGD